MNSVTADSISASSSPVQVIQWSARVEQERRQALSNLNRSVEGASLCTLRGERVDQAKYHEGQVAVLGEVLRALRGGIPVSPEGYTELLGVIRERWRGRAAEATAASHIWQSYIAGGLDALEQAARGN